MFVYQLALGREIEGRQGGYRLDLAFVLVREVQPSSNLVGYIYYYIPSSQ
jgi:hypothetical protein